MVRLEVWLEIVVIFGEQRARHGKALDLCPLLICLICALEHHYVRVLSGGFIQPLKRLANIFGVTVFTPLLAAQLIQR